MVARRVGAAIAAELGTMRVAGTDRRATHAGDTSGGLSRRAAAAGLQHRPALLTIEAMSIGIAASYVVGVGLYMASTPAYAWWNMLKYSHNADVMMSA